VCDEVNERERHRISNVERTTADEDIEEGHEITIASGHSPSLIATSVVILESGHGEVCLKEAQEIKEACRRIRVHTGPLLHDPHQDANDKHNEGLNPSRKENCTLPMCVHFVGQECWQNCEDVDRSRRKIEVYEICGTDRELRNDPLRLEYVLVLSLVQWMPKLVLMVDVSCQHVWNEVEVHHAEIGLNEALKHSEHHPRVCKRGHVTPTSKNHKAYHEPKTCVDVQYICQDLNPWPIVPLITECLPFNFVNERPEWIATDQAQATKEWLVADFLIEGRAPIPDH
jgi:hypothetical protein